LNPAVDEAWENDFADMMDVDGEDMVMNPKESVESEFESYRTGGCPDCPSIFDGFKT
jgi:hypothetical protein